MKEFLFKRGFILPIVVTGVIPIMILWITGMPPSLALFPSLIGALLFILGLGLLIWTTRLFAHHQGSLAPWNPPSTLVLAGPYRHCRNPMISGVYAMLLGEVLVFQSPWLAGWCLVFMIVMTSHIVFQEEPLLLKRFGPAYAQYCKMCPGGSRSLAHILGIQSTKLIEKANNFTASIPAKAGGGLTPFQSHISKPDLRKVRPAQF